MRDVFNSGVMANAGDSSRVSNAEYGLAELQPESDFRQSSVAVADRDKTKRGPGHQGIAGLANAGRDRDRDERVGLRSIRLSQ